ncbi:hypothetical protein ACPC54_30330 [Kitasatospora sp. NPDC094028]
MTKKNRSTAATLARQARRDGVTGPHRELLRTFASDTGGARVGTLIMAVAGAPNGDATVRARRAQDLADLLAALTRAGTGERYEACAEVTLITPLRDDEELYGVLALTARRPWEQDWQAVAQDVQALVAARPDVWPTAPEREKAAWPTGSEKAIPADAPAHRTQYVEHRVHTAGAPADLRHPADSTRLYPAPLWPESADLTAPFRPDRTVFAAHIDDPAELDGWMRTLCLRCACRVSQACPKCPGCYCYNDRCDGLRHRQRDLDGAGVFMLNAMVPKGIDERAFAQYVADTVRTVTREATGETYPARAVVHHAAVPWQQGPVDDWLPEDRQYAYLLVECESVRDWDPDDEIENTEQDMARAIEAGVRALYPAPWDAVAYPTDTDAAKRFHDRRVWAVATRDADPLVLRNGWQDDLDHLNATAPGTRPTHVTDNPKPEAGWPHRLVDAHWQGWLHTEDGHYQATSGTGRGLDQPWTHAQITTSRGPVRPVLPPPAEDTDRLTALWAQAGHQALATTLAALHRLVLRFPAGQRPHPVMSGREGSWETLRLIDLAWGIGSDIDGQMPTRYDGHAATAIADVLEGWARRPEYYTEVAETLAQHFGQHVDRTGGWNTVTEPWLRPGSELIDPDTLFLIASWLLASSDHLDIFAR